MRKLQREQRLLGARKKEQAREECPQGMDVTAKGQYEGDFLW